MHSIYFQETGKSAFVMLRYNNFPYLYINSGDHFGLMDIVLAMEQKRKQENEAQQLKSNNMGTYVRLFTVQALEQSGLLTLSVDYLLKMQFEFHDYFDDLFADGLQRLVSTTKQKMRAIVYLE